MAHRVATAHNLLYFPVARRVATAHEGLCTAGAGAEEPLKLPVHGLYHSQLEVVFRLEGGQALNLDKRLVRFSQFGVISIRLVCINPEYKPNT